MNTIEILNADNELDPQEALDSARTLGFPQPRIRELRRLGRRRLAERTRGVCVGARAEIYRVLTDLARRGVAIVVVSCDIEEVLRISHRIVVFSWGRVADVIERADVNRARLTRAAAMKETA